MADIFISYASEDRDRVRVLAEELRRRNWTVWWDRNILAGQAFDTEIERELEGAKCVVVIWSRHSVNSEWVKNEAAAAAERGVLIPAMIDRVQLPLEFRRRQTVDLTHWETDAGRTELVALLDGIAAVANLAHASLQPSLAPATPSPSWRRSLIAGSFVALLLAVSVFTYWKSSAKDSLSGTWAITQINQSAKVKLVGELKLVEVGAKLTGSLVWDAHAPGDVVDVAIANDQVEIAVQYAGGLQGVYRGVVSRTRDRMDGTTEGGGARADWFATRK